jgi:hypothetical protein
MIEMKKLNPVALSWSAGKTVWLDVHLCDVHLCDVTIDQFV